MAKDRLDDVGGGQPSDTGGQLGRFVLDVLEHARAGDYSGTRSFGTGGLPWKVRTRASKMSVPCLRRVER